MEPNPSFFSLAFHTAFFPGLLRRRLRRHEEPHRFGGDVPIEYRIALFVCVLTAIFSLPAAGRGSVAGGVIGGLGVVGFLALCLGSLRAGMEHGPTWERFLPAVFFFFVVLGLTTGLLLGGLYHSRVLSLLAGAAGALLGYGAGITAGLWIQRLGWIAAFFDAAAIWAIVGMFAVDVFVLR